MHLHVSGALLRVHEIVEIPPVERHAGFLPRRTFKQTGLDHEIDCRIEGGIRYLQARRKQSHVAHVGERASGMGRLDFVISARIGTTSPSREGSFMVLVASIRAVNSLRTLALFCSSQSSAPITVVNAISGIASVTSPRFEYPALIATKFSGAGWTAASILPSCSAATAQGAPRPPQTRSRLDI